MDTDKKEALEPWRPLVIINDNPNRPISSYRFDGLTPLSHYEVQINVENHHGKSNLSRFVFGTSEGLCSPIESKLWGTFSLLSTA